MLPVGERGSRGRGLPSWPEVRECAQRADAGGLDSVWFADHLLHLSQRGRVRGMHDSWTLLSAVAAVTERVELGPLVLCSSFRSPGLVANMAVTLDDVSAGRLVLGLGAGWHDPEYEAFGFPTDNRVGRFGEGLEIVTRLLRGERLTFSGRWYGVRDAALAPAPRRRIPVLVAAFRPRMLRLTARHADAWNTAWYRAPGDEPLRRAIDAFEAALAEEGRGPAEVTRTVGVEVREEEIGALVKTLDGYAALGFDHLIVRVRPPTPRAVEALARAVAVRRG
jgi:alkanesulfonate monooxygenase SsuD/methylene tetrahydromethanopterin reductase-like flavin-dependent oxidoreductase (luciferase family)